MDDPNKKLIEIMDTDDRLYILHALIRRQIIYPHIDTGVLDILNALDELIKQKENVICELLRYIWEEEGYAEAKRLLKEAECPPKVVADFLGPSFEKSYPHRLTKTTWTDINKVVDILIKRRMRAKTDKRTSYGTRNR